MVTQHYRWDFVGLSTDTKPTPANSEKVVDGSTFYCSDTSKLYVFCKDTWYERKALGSGGGGTTYTAGSGIDIADNTISVDTDTIQEKLTAGSNVSISGNTISATDTTYLNFTGTDGTAVGTAGLVPAPATTDAGKFLKADGTWDSAGGGGGGGAIKLTTADYNYDTNGGSNYNTIAIWLLPDDIYQLPDSSVSVTGAISGTNYDRFTTWINNRDAKYFIKSNNKFWFMADPSSADSFIGTGAPIYYCSVNSSGYFYVSLDDQLVTKNQLPS